MTQTEFGKDTLEESILDAEPRFDITALMPANPPTALRKHLLVYRNKRLDLQSAEGQTLHLKGIVYAPDVRRDERGTPLVDTETGEVLMGIRCLLHTSEGLYTSMSPLVYARCKELLADFSPFGFGPLVDTVTLKIEKYRTQNGRRAFNLIVVEDEEEA